MADISIINNGNTDYNVKDSAGREALAEVENKGAKNLLKITATSQTHKGVTFTINDDQTVTVNGTNDGTGASTFIIVPNEQAITIPDGNYILSGCPAGGGESVPFDLRWYKYSPEKSAYDSGNGAFVEKSGNTVASNIAIVVKTGQTANNLTFKPMLCTKAEWDISQAYVPYGKTNAELTSENTSQQAEINHAVNTGVKNLFDINTSLPLKIYHTTYTLSDGSLTVTSNGSWGHHSVPVNLPAGNYIFTATISNFSKDSSASATSVRMRVTDTTATGGIEIASKAVTGNGAFELPFTWTGGQCYIQYYPNYTSTTTYVSSFTASNNMICPATITDPKYEPYALPNPTLTPAAIKAVDDGAKNDFDLDTLFPFAANYNVTASKSNGAVSITSTGFFGRCSIPYNFRSGTSVFSCSVSSFTQAGGESAVRFTKNADGTGQIAERIIISGNGKYNTEIAVSSDTAGYIVLYINGSGQSYANSAVFSDLMVCTAADWAVSQKFVPYCPTNRELYEEKIDHDIPEVSGSILDYADTLAQGIYFARQRSSVGSGKPVNNRRYAYNIYVYSSATATIMAIEGEDPSNPRMFLTNKISGTWSSWYKFEGTKVT